MALSVKILTDADFDNLPYPEAKMSLGLADTKRGEAYVRYTHSPELNEYLINHELEHLLGEDRDDLHHGGEGVYYKGFGNIFSGIGNMIGGAGRSIGGAANSIGQGVMGLFGGGQTKPLQVEPKGMAGMAARGGPQMAGPMNVPMLPSSGMSPRIGPQVAPINLANPMSMFGNISQPKPPQPTNSNMSMPKPPQPMQVPQAPQSQMASFDVPMKPSAPMAQRSAPMNGMTPNIIPTSRPGTMPSPQMQPSAQMAGMGGPEMATPGVSVGGGKDAMSMFGKNPQQTLLGAGLEGIGQFGIQTPNMPDISELPSVQQLRNFNFNSIGELDPALEQAINNDFQRIEEREYQAFVARYKSLRPGADIESDSNFKRDLMELQRMQGSRRADALAKYRFEMIQTNLQISQAELAQLQDMAQMDIDVIMGQMGLDYANAQKFKDTFTRLGDTMISQGMGIGQEEEVSA